MAVATNKRYAPTIKLINHFNWQNILSLLNVVTANQKLEIRMK